MAERLRRGSNGTKSSRRASAPADAQRLSQGLSVPDPPHALHLTVLDWAAGTPLHRIHLNRFAANAFNPGVEGNARFSPIADASGRPVPTLYAGSTFECAAMETVFHDVPFAPGLKTFDKRRLEAQSHSVLIAADALRLADLRNVPLRKLGVPRNRLIDTEADTFSRTRRWAEAIHAQDRTIQGLCWTSRQDDRAMAAMLFGDRISARALHLHAAARSLSDDPDAFKELLALADAIGVLVVSGLD